MPIDMFVLPMSDFYVVLGMNSLNKYHVVIDCVNTTLSLELNDARVTHELVCPRPMRMPTIGLWEMPSLTVIRVEEKDLIVEMVPVVCKYPYMFHKSCLDCHQ